MQNIRGNKPKRRFKNLKQNLKEMQHLNLNPEDMIYMDKIIPKEPYHRPGAKEFLQACKEGDDLKVIILLAQDKHILHIFDSMKMTGLHWACKRNHFYVAKVLLEHKAYVNSNDHVTIT